MIALAIAPSKLVWVIVATLVIQQLENAVLVPRVMRKAVGVNPFVSLLAIFAFSSLFGFLGALDGRSHCGHDSTLARSLRL